MSLFSCIRRLLHKPALHTEPKPEPASESPVEVPSRSNSRTAWVLALVEAYDAAGNIVERFPSLCVAAAAPAAYKKEAIKKAITSQVWYRGLRWRYSTNSHRTPAIHRHCCSNGRPVAAFDETGHLDTPLIPPSLRPARPASRALHWRA